MKTQHVFSASAAAVLAMTMAAFAQAPATQTAPPQANRQPETPVTLVGCVQREADYRKANDAGRGGPAATGLGLGNEFVLVNASKTAAGSWGPAAVTDCSAARGGEAYELTGSREKELAKYVGRHIEVTGTLKEAKTEAGPAGEPKPTGGVDPLKQDLRLFEVNVASFRPVTAQTAAAAPPAPAPESPAAPPAQSTPSIPPPSEQSASAATLPRTASPLPLVGLLGLLSLTTGLVLRRRS
jgi:hypothetical protein